MATSGRRVGRPLRPALWLAAAIAFAACGSDDGSGAPVATGGTGSAVDVVAELDYLGDLAVFESEPMTVEVDSEAAGVTLPDGATVEVPVGAFGAPTVLTAGVAELDFARFEDDAPSGTMYVLGTIEDVDLREPVVLEVPVATDAVRVIQQVDGEWRLIDVPPGETTRVPIAGFSTVSTAVVEVGPPPATVRGLPGGDSPADFLFHCTIAVGLMFDEDLDDDAIDGFAIDRALSICTTALIDRLSPTGVHVSVACVGDRIDETGEIESAIASCAEESEAGDSAGAIDAATTTAAPPATEPSGAVPDDIGPLAWDGDLTLQEGSSLVPVGEQWISITRTAGTNDFEGAMEVATMGDHEFAVDGQIDPVPCTSVLTKRFTGTGTFDADFPNQIVLSGDQEVDVEYDCSIEVAETLDGTKPFEVFVFVTDTGIEGVFEGFEFDLPGVPVPLPG